jgi:chemotaxis protein methyltransferase CheR
MALPTPLTISQKAFKTIQELISHEAGIKLSDFKKAFLISRLTPRLKALGCAGFHDYLEILTNPAAQAHELGQLINRITTNETRFFREKHHFDFLVRSYLPARFESGSSPRKFSIWSAGCATGEEAYSLAMVLADLARDRPFFSYSIWATDIDQEALGRARQGIFPDRAARSIPDPFLKNYCLKGAGERAGLIKIRPSLRKAVAFDYFNLNRPTSVPRGPFEAIFCRNVLIYFQPPVRDKVVRFFHRHLRPAGLLFLGHSENLWDMKDAFKPLGKTMYQRIP